jgi:hypothetical protein
VDDNSIHSSHHTFKQAKLMLDDLAKYSPDYEFYIERFDAKEDDFVRITYHVPRGE